MCGLAGFLRTPNTPERDRHQQWATRMADAIVHRGPDAGGVPLAAPSPAAGAGACAQAVRLNDAISIAGSNSFMAGVIVRIRPRAEAVSKASDCRTPHPDAR